MNEAVFIADLHLSPDNEVLQQRFERFIIWAAKNTRSLYILGDFLHLWPGDDAMNAWSAGIANQLTELAEGGIKIYFMAGNRDFLLGKKFARAASMTILPDPTVITLGKDKILLSHGDRYCTADRGHQWLRFVTRNRIFTTLFMLLPFKIRDKLVGSVREYSRKSRNKPPEILAIDIVNMLLELSRHKTSAIIHGHIHQKHDDRYHSSYGKFRHLSVTDWDDITYFLCYNRTKGLYFFAFK